MTQKRGKQTGGYSYSPPISLANLTDKTPMQTLASIGVKEKVGGKDNSIMYSYYTNRR